MVGGLLFVLIDSNFLTQKRKQKVLCLLQQYSGAGEEFAVLVSVPCNATKLSKFLNYFFFFQLTNVDTKIRQTQANAASNVAASNPSKRSKENPNIERRVVMDFPVSLVCKNCPQSAYIFAYTFLVPKIVSPGKTKNSYFSTFFKLGMEVFHIYLYS